MTPIADMVAEMMARGVDPEVIVMAVRTAELASMSGGHRVDTTADRRRAWDRERKRQTRDQRLPDNEWIELRNEIVERDGNRCKYCGTSEKLTADHVVPMSRGGTHDPSNLVACCIPCNTKKGNKLLSEWLPKSADVHPNPPDTDSALSFLESKKEEKKERKKERGEKIPPDWTPNAGHMAAGQKLGFSDQQIFEQAEDMRLWAQSNGHRAVARKSDWDLTFLGWLRRNKPKAEINGKRTVHQAAADLLERVRALDEPAPSHIRDGTGQGSIRRLSSG